MLHLESVAQLANGRGLSLGLNVGQRIAAPIDVRPQLPGLGARVGRIPVRPAANGVAALAAAAGAVVEDEERAPAAVIRIPNPATSSS